MSRARSFSRKRDAGTGRSEAVASGDGVGAEAEGAPMLGEEAAEVRAAMPVVEEGERLWPGGGSGGSGLRGERGCCGGGLTDRGEGMRCGDAAAGAGLSVSVGEAGAGDVSEGTSKAGLGGLEGVSRRPDGVGGNCFLIMLPPRSRPVSSAAAAAGCCCDARPAGDGAPACDCCCDARPGGEGIGLLDSRRSMELVPSLEPGGVGISLARHDGAGGFDTLRPSELLRFSVSTCSRTDRRFPDVPPFASGTDSFALGDCGASAGGAAGDVSRFRSSRLEDDSGIAAGRRGDEGTGAPSPWPLPRMRAGDAPMRAALLLGAREGDVRVGEVRPKP